MVNSYEIAVNAIIALASVAIWFTFVVVDAVITDELERDAAVDTLPAFVATAAPQAVGRGFARAVFAAVFGTSFECAMFAVPAAHAQTRAVFALAVLVATEPHNRSTLRYIALHYITAH